MKKYILIIGILIASQAAAQHAIFSLDTIITNPGSQTSIPIKATNLNGMGSLTLFIAYNPAKAVFIDASSLHPLLAQGQLIINQIQGSINISWYDLAGLSIADEILLRLNFTLVEDRTALIFSQNCEVTDTLGIIMATEYRPGLLTSVLQVSVSAADSNICPGTGTQLFAVAKGGIGEYVYQWSSSPAGFNSTIHNPEVWPSSSTQYVVTVSDQSGTQNASIQIQVLAGNAPASFTKLFPANGAQNLETPVHLSWLPPANSDYYDVYIWSDTLQMPASPAYASLKGVQQPIMPGPLNTFEYGQSYLWKVVAHNKCASTASAVQGFHLRPLPDLVIDSISVTPVVYAGDNITITYRVTNISSGNTGTVQWVDAFFLSFDTFLVQNLIDANNDYKFGWKDNLGYLGPGDSYIGTVSYPIPLDAFGFYYIIAAADNGKYPNWSNRSVVPPPGTYPTLKEVNDSNNICTLWQDALIEVLKPPTPDLEILSAGYPKTIFSGDSMTVAYQVKNIGDGPAIGKLVKAYNLNPCLFKERYWKDRISISPDSVLTLTSSSANGIFPGTGTVLGLSTLGVRSQYLGIPQHCDTMQLSIWNHFPDTLAPDSTFVFNQKIKIPHNFGGTYYLFVEINIGHTFLEHDKANNTFVDTIHVLTSPQPDLVVDQLTVTDSCMSGETIPLLFRVRNAGAVKPSELFWRDYIFISKLGTFDVDSCHFLNFQNVGGIKNFLADSTYTRVVNMKIPHGISGDYYVYVFTDYLDNVFEFPNDTNNLTRSALPLHIGMSPTADLVITAVVMPDSIFQDSTACIIYTIYNQGNNTAIPPWHDAIFMSSAPNWSPAHAKMKEKIHGKELEPQASYTDTLKMVVPIDVFGERYFWLFTDCRNHVYEGDSTANNIVRHDGTGSTTTLGPLTIYPDPRQPLLKVKALTFPDTIWNGAFFQAFWTVENVGLDHTTTTWLDHLFVSTDTLLDDNDILIGSAGPFQNISLGNSYVGTLIEAMTRQVSGDLYLLLMVDGYQQTNAGNLVTQVADFVYPIHVVYVPPPDLVVLSVDLPDTLLTGQVATATIRVLNQGDGPANESVWFDRYTLKADPTLPSWNAHVGTRKQPAIILPDSSYSFSLDFDIPITLSGIYCFHVEIDYQDQVFESNETNNAACVKWVTITSAPPSDLIVSQIDAPGTIRLGEKAQISYTVKNIGTNPATGRLDDGLYFSADAVYQGSDDPITSSVTRNVLIQPGDSLRDTVFTSIPAVLPGDYRNIARTNITQRIPETDIYNNTLVAPSGMTVEVEDLPLEIFMDTLINADREVYFRIQPGAGKDLLISLSSDSSDFYNEISLGIGKVPTPSRYDFKSDNPGEEDQMILVPNTMDTHYYLMARSMSYSIGDQRVRLLAQAIPFSLISNAPARVGNDVVTTVVRGAAFTPNTQFFLVDSTNQVVTEARIKRLHSSMQASLRWDLKEVPLGRYNLMANNQDSTVFLSDALEVVASTNFSMDIITIAPAAFSYMSYGNIAYQFKNVGNIDIPYFRAAISMLPYLETKIMSLSEGLYTRSMMMADTLFRNPAYDFMLVEDMQRLQLVGKDLAPGEVAEVKLKTGRFLEDPNAFWTNIHTYTLQEFVQTYMSVAEIVRLTMLADPLLFSLDQYPGVIDFVDDSAAFHDFMRYTLLAGGIVDPNDTLGLDWSPYDGLNPLNNQYLPDSLLEFTFKPGIHCGTNVYSNVTFGEGDDYLWEINKYSGVAGAPIGWDLIRVNGILNITASTFNPFVLRIKSLDYDNNMDYLGGWYPAVDISWPIAIATGGITGFDPNKFIIDDSRFTLYNELYGGHFSIGMSGTDTLMLHFAAYKPGVGEDGVPGARGGIGEAGSPGGKGGDGDGIMPPGKGGRGGDGGYGRPGEIGGAGGPGGPGGNGGPGQDGGQGGTGGDGEIGGFGGSGGPGGKGGDGDGIIPPGKGGRGGNGGYGGYAANGGAGGPGGSGGNGGPGQDGGQGGPGGNGGNGGPGGMAGPGGPGGPGGLAGPAINQNVKYIAKDGDAGVAGSYGSDNVENEEYYATGDKGISHFDPKSAQWRRDNPPPCREWEPIGNTKVRCERMIHKFDCSMTLMDCTSSILEATGKGAAAGTLFTPAGTAAGAAAGAAWGGAQCVNGLYSCLLKGTFYNPVFDWVSDVMDQIDCYTSVMGYIKCKAKEDCLRSQRACDPNEIEGPVGYGDGRFVSVNDVLPYAIHFENDSNLATAPAKAILIRHTLNQHLNPASFRLGSIFFNNMDFVLPQSVPNVNMILDLPDSLGYDVRVTAGINISTREALWILQTIDPQTGMEPTDPFTGLLPINDAFNAGQGLVSFTVKPLSSSMTGDTIHAKAEIIFDFNPPIETPQIFNIIDALPPLSMVDQIPHTSDSLRFDMKILTQDDQGGSGVKQTNLYVSENGSPFSLFNSVLSDSTISFTGQAASQYAFLSQAIDNVNNQEAPKFIPELIVTVQPAPLLITTQPSSQSICLGEVVNFYVEAQGTKPYTYHWLFNGFPLAGASTPDYQFTPLRMDQQGYYSCRVSNATDTVYSNEALLTILPIPIARAGSDTGFCSGANLILSGEGDFAEWLWSNGQDQQTIIVDQPGMLTLTVRDSMGCYSEPDTIIIAEYPLPLVSAGMDDTIVEGNQTILQGSATGEGPFSWTWLPSTFLDNPHAQNPVASPDFTTQYILVVTDQNGCIATDDVEVVVTPAYIYSISGTIQYGNAANTPLAQTKVIIRTLAGDSAGSATSDPAGFYLIDNLARGDYSMTVQPSIPWGGVNAVDALLTAKHFVGYTALEGIRMKAGDVDLSGFLNSADALLMLQRFVDIIPGFPSGDWLQTSDTIAITNSSTTANYQSLCYGDVNASYLPGLKKEIAVGITTQGKIAPWTETLLIPVAIDRELVLGSMSLVMQWPEKGIQLLEIQPFSGFENMLTQKMDNGMKLAWYQPEGKVVHAGDILFSLKIKILKETFDPWLPLIGPGTEFSDREGSVLKDVNLLIPEVDLAFPDQVTLEENYPNPFSTTTEIRFSLPRESRIRLCIYDTPGQLIQVLEESTREAGRHTLTFDASRLSRGVYLYELSVEENNTFFKTSKKMIIAR